MGQKTKTIYLYFLSLITSIILSSTILAYAAEEAVEEKVESTKETAEVVLDLHQTLNGADGIDFVCEADVFYKWQKNPPMTKIKEKGRLRNVKPTPHPTVETFFTQVGEQGLAGIDVKKKLELRLSSIKAEAMKACKRDHENDATCIAGGIKSNSSDYSRMDFASRKALLDAITSQCYELRGRCLSAESKEIRCYLNKPPDSTPIAEKKQDSKKKVKK